LVVTAEPRDIPIKGQQAPAVPPLKIPTTPPEGYSAEVHSVMTISSGESLSFSVPRNHVSENWFLRVRFSLAVNKPQVGSGPYSYVEFFEEQIPESQRGPRESIPSA
jgi:hypothetical protein